MVVMNLLVISRQEEIVEETMPCNGGKIDKKWTLGGLKINCRYATIDFQPSQSPFLIDFPSVTVHSFSKDLYLSGTPQ